MNKRQYKKYKDKEWCRALSKHIEKLFPTVPENIRPLMFNIPYTHDELSQRWAEYKNTVRGLIKCKRNDIIKEEIRKIYDKGEQIGNDTTQI